MVPRVLPCDLALKFDLFLEIQTLAITCIPEEIQLSYFTCTFLVTRLFSSPEPKAQVSYCHRAPSVIRPLTFTFSTSSPEPLDGFWWNLVGMKYSWSLTSVVVFRPDPPRGGSRAGQNRSWGVPFFKKLLLQTRRLQRQTECIAVI